ncbi:Crp/Fnr family transcriptional regulator [Virgibacillus byunsanensis]|uniref:Crp/Fnr family transcriptional regulator n=1 Tax=Virgibacillus byunsanensis TaxID=570945 RepID=A0ABW3LQJ6_9BACI
MELALEQETFTGGNTDQFTKEWFRKVKGLMNECVYPTGTNVFLEGDLADKMYYVKSGSIKLTKTTDDGKDLCLYYYKTGDMFGEYNYSDEKMSTFTAEVIQNATIGVIEQRDLEVLMWRHSNLAIEFSKWLGYMQQFTQMKLRDLMFHGKNGALASTLIRIANTYGVQGKKGISFVEKFTNAELASLIGATRETVNRMLGQLKKDKIIDYNHGRILILDLDALKAICHCEECPLGICRL